jgi:hypothetical protein
MSRTSDPKTGPTIKGMWINPKSNLNRESGRREWQAVVEAPDGPQTARNLELASVLRLKEPIRMKTKAAAAGAHQTGAKSEPCIQGKLRPRNLL